MSKLRRFMLSNMQVAARSSASPTLAERRHGGQCERARRRRMGS